MNGYTQLNLDKLRGFKWGKYAFEKYMRMLNFKPDEDVTDTIGNKLASEHSAIILYCGLCMNCFVKQQEPDFSFEDCVEWDENISEENAKLISDAITECTWFKNHNEAVKKNLNELEKLLQENGGKTKKKKSDMLAA